ESNGEQATSGAVKRTTQLTPFLLSGRGENAGWSRHVSSGVCFPDRNPSPWPSPRAALRGEGNDALQRAGSVRREAFGNVFRYAQIGRATCRGRESGTGDVTRGKKKHGEHDLSSSRSGGERRVEDAGC